MPFVRMLWQFYKGEMVIWIILLAGMSKSIIEPLLIQKCLKIIQKRGVCLSGSKGIQPQVRLMRPMI